MGLDAEIARREAEVAALRTRALAAAQADLAAKERELQALRDEVACKTGLRFQHHWLC